MLKVEVQDVVAGLHRGALMVDWLRPPSGVSCLSEPLWPSLEFILPLGTLEYFGGFRMKR